MNIVSVDLGTTNIKAAVYDSSVKLIDLVSEPVIYDRRGNMVEFDAEHYANGIITLIRKAAQSGFIHNGQTVSQIILTGQAESLVVLGEDNLPCYPGISWLDMRSEEECRELSGVFTQDLLYRTTGQPDFIPTWPITKLLWLKHNKPDVFNRIRKVLLLKDYIIFRLCGNPVEEYAVASFSCYFDIVKKEYWSDILSYCGISEDQLPVLVPSGSVAGTLLPGLASSDEGLTLQTKINAGTLDHFAGMIGTGSISPGFISESAGTVLSIAALADQPVFKGKLPNYCGPFPDSYVLLPVCESGGFSMEWYKNEFLKDVSYKEMNSALAHISGSSVPMFLPYLTGVNPPEYDPNIKGVFFGIRAEHTRFDMALGVMQGVACILRKNLDYMKEAGVQINKITTSGGGAKSDLWCQIKCDITGFPIEVPSSEEAPCLGSAIMAAVSEGYFPDYDAAIRACVSLKKCFYPSNAAEAGKRYSLFCHLYQDLQECFRM